MKIKSMHIDMIVRKVFREYSQKTSIHGFQYLGLDKSNWIIRLFWTLALVISMTGCSYLIYVTHSKWRTSPVIVSFNEKSSLVNEIPFPSVTICPESKFKKEYTNYMELMKLKVDTLTLEQQSNLDAIFQICKVNQQTNRTQSPIMNANFMHKIFHHIGIPFSNTFRNCKWRGTTERCEDLFHELMTDDGLCYTFNMQHYQDLYHDEIDESIKYPKHDKNSTHWDFQMGYEDKNADAFPFRVIDSGFRAGLNIKLSVKKSDLDFNCKGLVQGFKIALHSPGELPRLWDQFFQIPLEQQVLVAVRPQVLTTADGLKSYRPTARQCYFNDEKILKYFKTYTQWNCELECLTEYTFKRCGCVKFSQPHNTNLPVCNATKLKCYQNAKKMLMLQKLDTNLREDNDNDTSDSYGHECHCLPSCTSIKYDAEISQSKISDVNGSFDEKSSLKIFFRDSYFIKSKRSELYGWIDFLANCGGLLGLTMGFSILSLVELVYHFSLDLFFNYNKYQSYDLDVVPEKKTETFSNKIMNK